MDASEYEEQLAQLRSRGGELERRLYEQRESPEWTAAQLLNDVTSLRHELYQLAEAVRDEARRAERWRRADKIDLFIAGYCAGVAALYLHQSNVGRGLFAMACSAAMLLCFWRPWRRR